MKKKRQTKGNKTIKLLILFCIVMAMSAVVAAKYIDQTANNDAVTAKEFYFTSDILDGQAHKITADQSDQTAKINIQLTNHADELRFSEVDIDYVVTLKDQTNGKDIALNNTNSANATGKIGKGKCNEKSVTISGLEPGKTYEITATTNNTYRKTLKGTVEVSDTDNKIHQKILDEKEYIEVTIWTVDYSGEIKLEYPQGLIPDNTDEWMAAAKSATDTSQTLTLESDKIKENTSHTFRFFKENTDSTYNVRVDNEGKKVTISEQTK